MQTIEQAKLPTIEKTPKIKVETSFSKFSTDFKTVQKNKELMSPCESYGKAKKVLDFSEEVKEGK